MTVHTTLHVHAKTLSRIDAISAETGTSRNAAIVMLLRRAMRPKTQLMKPGTAVRYQGADEQGAWMIMHVFFTGDEYEFFTDMRKAFKMSVSLILAQMASDYKATREGTDNYHYHRHVTSFIRSETLVFLGYYWKTAPNKP